MRVALVHDWLTGMRGGEWVLDEIASLFPGAPIYTLVHRPGAVSAALESHPIHTSFLQRIPGATRTYRRYLPIMPLAAEAFDLREFDLVISSSHCVAKGVRPAADAMHIAYIHTPMRYVWHLYDDYARTQGPLARIGMAVAAHHLRVWDVSSSDRVDHFIANSETVARRIAQVYRREADVIPPPVDTEFFHPGGETGPGREGERSREGDYYLLVSALVPYKRIEIAVEAFARSGRRLVIVGEGPEEGRLRRLLTPDIELIGWQPRERLRALYRQARALVFPGLEDFGMSPVEALGCGTPVIAYGAGGVTESVRGPVVGPSGPTGDMEGMRAGVGDARAGDVWMRGDRASSVSSAPTGVFFRPQTSAALVRALEEFEQMEFDPRRLRGRAEEFSRARFRGRLADAVRRLAGYRFEPGVEDACADTQAS